MTILADPNQWPHRFDETAKAVGFIPLSREIHRASTFVTDAYLPKGLNLSFISAREFEGKVAEVGQTVHFVLHSAYCCSTMVARAFDIPGVSMGLKEPQILNDILGWRRRGAAPEDVRHYLRLALNLLSRPMASGEVNVIKPSNIFNALAAEALQIVPDAKAVLLYAPIESYLQSIAKKGLWGRRWVREVLTGALDDGILISGFEDQNLLELTDLQVAALGWISHFALFRDLQNRFGADRIILQNSAGLLSENEAVMRKLLAHFGLELDVAAIQQVLEGPAFTTHSKDQAKQFGADDRAQEQADMAKVHKEEIDLVTQWTKAVANSQGLNL